VEVSQLSRAAVDEYLPMTENLPVPSPERHDGDPHQDALPSHFDAIIVGSGFGGSVSALRLAEQGDKVLVIEKGRRFGPDDFAKTNWNLRRWMWMPWLGLRGIFKMTFFRHVTTLTGVGVGGGSLTYANTLPTPTDEFFSAASWSQLADWREELMPHYETARHMLGATPTPCVTTGDRILKQIATEMGREEHFESNDVGVYFGEEGVTVEDPYFGGAGPDRTGCKFCGACMTGCRHGAKNTLDQNYLYLAEQKGAQVLPETRVVAIRPRGERGADGASGYVVEARQRRGWLRHRTRRFTADRVVLAGGVLGTVELLLRMKADPDGLPNLSDRLGGDIRTNSESLIGVVTPDRSIDFSEGIAITSIFHTDEHSHVEPVRYGKGSGFFRLLTWPHAPGANVVTRFINGWRNFLRRPWRWMRALVVRDYARQWQVLLYMRTLEGKLRFVLKRSPFRFFGRVLASRHSQGDRPTAAIPEATEIAERFADKTGGVTQSLATENLFAIPTTAHILGGCCMGESGQTGVIDADHRAFGYQNLFVVDGSAVSANPGVNPSLTITALAERAMHRLGAARGVSPSADDAVEDVLEPAPASA
jgi:cholesterol oxidase